MRQQDNIVRLSFKASANNNPSSDDLTNERPVMSVVMCGLTGRGRILQTKGSRLNIKYSQKNEYFLLRMDIAIRATRYILLTY